MKTALVENADQAAVSEAIAAALKRRGAAVTERTHSHIRFAGLNPGDAYSFAKGGYVGTYRRAGETDVEIRLRVEATVPARVFWWTVGVDLVLALLLFAVRPPGSTWVAAAFFLWAAFLAALLLHAGTWRTTWRVERELLADIVAAVAPRGERVLTEDELAARRLEEEIEGELTARKLREARRTEPPAVASTGGRRSLFARKPKPATAPESLDEKRARLDALKAEIERRKRDGP